MTRPTRGASDSGFPSLNLARGDRLLATLFVGVSAAASAQTTPPLITAAPSPTVVLQTGPATQADWVQDNRWGQGTIKDRAFTQEIGVWNSWGPAGEVAYRTRWNWPQGTTEVKGFPAAIYGAKPGHYSTTSKFAGSYDIKLTDGSIRTEAPTGPTPGATLPLQLPLSNVTAKANWQHGATPTGQGQLTYDLWLQSSAKQDIGFVASSITHEIMVPLTNWGNYGAYPNGRNPAWYDHDATIGGRLWHVYITKASDGCWRYDFGNLNGAYGKTGWKMIAFVPDTPITGEIDLAALVNYMIGRKDACNQSWVQGNEYLVSSELGVEPVVGTGDITVFDHRFMTAASAPAPPPAPAPAPTPAPPSCAAFPQYKQGTPYTSGNVVTYNGLYYVAIRTNFRNIVPTNTTYWSRYLC